MRIVGIIRFRRAIILIDLGSTHNFMDTKLAAALRIQPLGQDGIKVKIANRQEVASPGKSREVEVKMQGYLFRTEFLILPLAGCDAVLGIQWLQTLGPILWDYTKLEMRFRYEDTSCTLHGLKQGSQMSWEEGDSFKLSKVERNGNMLYLRGQSTKGVLEPKQLMTVSGQPPLPSLVAAILDDYCDIFKEPKGLPPPPPP